MRAVVALRQGGPEVLEVRDWTEPVAGEGETLIRVAAAGVNFADLLSVRGQYAASPPPPFVPGLEVAGTDPAGRPVMAILQSGGYAELAVADSRLVFGADGLDPRQAAGFLLVSVTAWLGLYEGARLRPGETVLVTAGAGGLGSTAIQLAKHLGAARVIAMASTPAKREFALAAGADHAIGYEDEVPGPVDIVVDTVGGDAFRSTYLEVNHLGRMVLLGASSGEPAEIPSFDALRRRNVAVICFSFGMLRRSQPERIAGLAAPVVELLQTGKLRPPVGRVMDLGDAAEAHRLLASRATMGKLILTN